MERMSGSRPAMICKISRIIKTKQIARPLQRLAAIPTVLSGIKHAMSMKRQHRRFSCHYDFDDQIEEEEELLLRSSHDLKTSIPGDVSEGHLAVYAVKDEERVERFVIPVGYLKHPFFLKLLQKAEDEFAFNYRNGGLTLPCDPSVVARIIHLLTRAPHHHDHGVGSGYRLTLFCCYWEGLASVS